MRRQGSPRSTAPLAAVAAAMLCVAGCGGRGSRPTPVAARPLPSTPTTTATDAGQPPTTPATTTTTTPAAASPAKVSTTLSPTPATAPPKVVTCPTNLAAQLASTGSASQLITVDAPVGSATSATLTAWQRSGSCWVVAAGPWSAHLGYNGVSVHHLEGDGTTPSGAYGIGSLMYGNGPNPGVHYGYHPLVCGDWWDEDPNSRQYNNFQHVTCGAQPPFGGKSEALWTVTTAYQNFAVIDYNATPIVPGRGSAVFLHDDIGGATNGCVSLPASALTTVLRWLQPASAPLIVIGTDAEIRRW